ncbi:MAG: VOC family protein [Flammeovirgaceae bacterium]
MNIEHLAIWVKDLELMRQFYEKYFDVKAGEKYVNPKKQFQSYFLSFESGARLELMFKPEIAQRMTDWEKEKMGLAHFAIAVGSQEQVDECTEKLRIAGYEVIGETRWTGDGYYESVILDPENNRIEITI